MKLTLYSFILVLCIYGCTNKDKKKLNNLTEIEIKLEENQDSIPKHQLKQLYLIGDFDGDKKIDTLYQHIFSKRSNSEIIFSPNPFNVEWDSVVNWFYRQEAELLIRTNNPIHDTLKLGIAQGLYCLINIGDNNADGKDEIAFVIDYLDYSRLNSCNIYSLCNNKWLPIMTFGIHENSFDFTDSSNPLKIEEIKNSLEFHDGKWVYKGYTEHDYKSKDEVWKLLPLELKKCN